MNQSTRRLRRGLSRVKRILRNEQTFRTSLALSASSVKTWSAHWQNESKQNPEFPLLTLNQTQHTQVTKKRLTYHDGLTPVRAAYWRQVARMYADDLGTR